jgi:hypothetical protein
VQQWHGEKGTSWEKSGPRKIVDCTRSLLSLE